MYLFSYPGDLTLRHIDLKFSKNVYKGCPISYAKFGGSRSFRYLQNKNKLRGLHQSPCRAGVNPCTEGGLGQLRTGGDIRPTPGDLKKRSKLETKAVNGI